MVEQGTEGRVSLDWRLVFNAADVPRTLSATASGNPAFAALAVNPPRINGDAMVRCCRIVIDFFKVVVEIPYWRGGFLPRKRLLG